MACRLGLSWLLIAAVILLPGTFLLTYIISWQLGHVHPILPYISNTGTEPPESCIFGLLLNFAAVIMSCAIYARYRQVGEYLPDTRKHAIRLNKASLILGLVSMLGISIVANFQISTMLVVHGVGAMMAFGGGTVYAWTQSVVSFITRQQLTSLVVCCLRVVCCVVATVTLILMFAFIELATDADDSIDLWRVSTASEWILCVDLVVFFLTFFAEFMKISFDIPVLRFTASPPAESLPGVNGYLTHL